MDQVANSGSPTLRPSDIEGEARASRIGSGVDGSASGGTDQGSIRNGSTNGTPRPTHKAASDEDLAEDDAPEDKAAASCDVAHVEGRALRTDGSDVQAPAEKDEANDDVSREDHTGVSGSAHASAARGRPPQKNHPTWTPPPQKAPKLL